MRTSEVEELFEAPAPSWSPRRFIVAALALVVVAGIVAVAVVSRSTADALAELRVRDGSVSLLRETSPLVQAAEGEDLRSGDVLRTDAEGRAQIDFFDGSVVRLDRDTEVVLRTVATEPDGDQISLSLSSGRTWNRVTPQEPGDRFAVDLGGAVATAVGTTFLADCTSRPPCYVVGIDSTTEVRSTSGRQMDAQEGDCVAVEESGSLSSCDEKKLGLLDDWVKENLAEDQQLALERVAITATPSPTAGSGVRRTGAPQRVTAPTATPKVTPKPDPTDSPDPTIPGAPRPRRTKRPEPTLTPPPPEPEPDPLVSGEPPTS